MSRAACKGISTLDLAIPSDDDDISDADTYMSTGSSSSSSFSSHSPRTPCPSSLHPHRPPSPISVPPRLNTPPDLTHAPSSRHPQCLHHSRPNVGLISPPYLPRRFCWCSSVRPRRVAHRVRTPASVAEATQRIVGLHRRLARNAERTAELSAQQREQEDDATDAGLRGCVLERGELYLLIHQAHMDFVRLWDREIHHRHHAPHKRVKFAQPRSPPHSTSATCPAMSHLDTVEEIEAEGDN